MDRCLYGRGAVQGVSVRVPLVGRTYLDLGRVWSAACPVS